MTVDLRAHALTETIAAEALEGWSPTGTERAALSGLVYGELSFTDYVAGCVRRYRDAAPAREPVFARRLPYLLPGSTVLRNNFGLTSQAALTPMEHAVSAARLAQAHLRTGDNALALDVRALHQHTFADVYTWAGELRTTDIRRGNSRFAPVDVIANRLRRIADDVEELQLHGRGYGAAALGYRFARIYAHYNWIHPFRDGNGRTGTLLLHLLARASGARLSLAEVSRPDWVDAARASMPREPDSPIDHRLFAAILCPAVTRD